MAALTLSPEEADEIAGDDPIFGKSMRSAFDDAKDLMREIAESATIPEAAGAGASIAQLLAEGDRYVPKFPSGIVEGLDSAALEKMRNGETGLWNGTIRKATGNNQIEAQANFEKVNLSRERLEGLRTLALQAQVREISEQLDDLSEKLDNVLEGQHSDRIAEVESGIEMYDLANEYNDLDQRNRQIATAQQSLTNGRKKLERWLYKILDDKPRELKGVKEQALAAGGIHKPRIERLNELESKENQIQEALRYYVLASGYIAKIHAAQGEFEAANRFVEKHLGSLEEIGEKLQDGTIPLPPKVANRGRQLSKLHDSLREARSESIQLEFPAEYLLQK